MYSTCIHVHVETCQTVIHVQIDKQRKGTTNITPPCTPKINIDTWRNNIENEGFHK